MKSYSLKNGFVGGPLGAKGFFRDYKQMTKSGLVFFVVITAAMSYLMAVSGGEADWRIFAWLCLGTYLTASAAHVFNQIMEIGCDGKMERTRERPLCTGKIGITPALLLGAAFTVVGLGCLAHFVNSLTAFICLLTLILYLGAYTPLKKYSVLNTWVGAVPGALPALMGWSAGLNSLPVGAWSLFSIVLVWQIPHFLALAWRFRDDYRRGGLKMLTLADRDGRITAWNSVAHIFVLIAVSFLPFFMDQAGVPYLVLASALGLGFAYLGFRFKSDPDRYCRALFVYSIAYLPGIYLGLSITILDFYPF